LATGRVGECRLLRPYDYLLTTYLPRYMLCYIVLYSAFFFLLLLDVLRVVPIDIGRAIPMISRVTCSRETKKRKKCKHKKRLNFTRSGGGRIGHRAFRRVVRRPPTYGQTIETAIILLSLLLLLYTYILCIRVRRPYNVIHNVTYSVCVVTVQCA